LNRARRLATEKRRQIAGLRVGDMGPPCRRTVLTGDVAKNLQRVALDLCPNGGGTASLQARGGNRGVPDARRDGSPRGAEALRFQKVDGQFKTAVKKRGNLREPSRTGTWTGLKGGDIAFLRGTTRASKKQEVTHPERRSWAKFNSRDVTTFQRQTSKVHPASRTT